MVFWIFGGKGWLSWSVNYKGDRRTAWVWHDNWGIVNIIQKLKFLAGFGTLLQYLLVAWREEERKGQEEARYFQHLSKLVLRPEIRWYGNWTRRRPCTGLRRFFKTPNSPPRLLHPPKLFPWSRHFQKPLLGLCSYFPSGGGKFYPPLNQKGTPLGWKIGEIVGMMI